MASLFYHFFVASLIIKVWAYSIVKQLFFVALSLIDSQIWNGSSKTWTTLPDLTILISSKVRQYEYWTSSRSVFTLIQSFLILYVDVFSWTNLLRLMQDNFFL